MNAGRVDVDETRGQAIRAFDAGDYELAIELASTFPDDLTMVTVRARALAIRRRTRESCEVLEDALARYDRDSLVAVALACYLAAALCDDGRAWEARRVLEAVPAIDDRSGAGRLRWSWARLATFEGDLEAAERLMRDTLAELRETEDTAVVAAGAAALAEILNMRGNHAEALTVATEALEMSTVGPGVDTLAAAAEVAHARAGLGDVEAARTAGRAALAIGARDDLGLGKVRLALALAAARDSDGDVALGELSIALALLSAERRYEREILAIVREVVSAAIA